MATKKRQFDIMKVALAVGGGSAAGLVQTQVENFAPENLKQYSGPITAAIGAGLVYFADSGPKGENQRIFAYGLMGAAGADTVNAAVNMQGTSDIDPMNGWLSRRLKALRKQARHDMQRLKDKGKRGNPTKIIKDAAKKIGLRPQDRKGIVDKIRSKQKNKFRALAQLPCGCK